MGSSHTDGSRSLETHKYGYHTPPLLFISRYLSGEEWEIWGDEKGGEEGGGCVSVWNWQ